MKLSLRIGLAGAALYGLLNFSWVHAASIAMISDPCEARLLAEARISAAKLYGSTISSPIVGCVNRTTLWKSVAYGQTSFGLGVNPVILIGPKGANFDVVAHELGHAELFERLGYFYRSVHLPVWLDEGLAMQLDHRKEYNEQALKELQGRQDLKVPELENMTSTEFFVAGDQGKYHYAYSKCVVGRWVTENTNWLAELRDVAIDLPESMHEAIHSCSALRKTTQPRSPAAL